MTNITLPLLTKDIAYRVFICFSGLLILVVINGLTTTTMSVFDKTLLHEFHWTRTELKFRDSIPNATAFLLIFFAGSMIDKFQVKRLLLLGALVLAIALGCYSTIQSIREAYFMHFLFGLAYCLAGPVSAIILVSSWFNKRKGLALGFTLAGTSLGSVIFPNIIHHWIILYGWRTTFLALTIFPIILFFYILFFVKSRPQTPVLTDSNAIKVSVLEGLTFKEATRTFTYLVICVCGFLTFYSLLSVVANLHLHITDIGLSEQYATGMLSLYFGVAFTGKMLITTLSDYVNIYRLFSICCLILTLAIGLFATVNPALIVWATVGMALSWGGIYSMYNVLTVRTFGLKEAGKINASINMFESAGGFLGPIVTGYLHDQTHSYQMAFMLVAIIMGLATVLSFFLGKNG